MSERDIRIEGAGFIIDVIVTYVNIMTILLLLLLFLNIIIIISI